MTEPEQAFLDSPTGAKLALYIWKSEENPKGVVHINHGLSEHARRFSRFANFLNTKGYHVIAHDHRGHGNTTSPDSHQGLFSNQDGWNKVVLDVDAVNEHIHANHPGIPLILFGHSMGSLIGLNYCISNSSKLSAAALWNSGSANSFMISASSFLFAIERMFKGSDVPSTIANSISFKTWNKKFAPNRTEFDWLSRDENEVDAYINDPLCGGIACNGLWQDLLQGLRNTNEQAQLAKIRKNLPFHLLAGGMDPSCNHGKALAKLSTKLKRAGIKDIAYDIHMDNRHEALNELNRDEIMVDFVNWLNKHFAK